MQSSSNKNGYTKLENFVYDDIFPTLTLPAQSIYMKINRQTAGWRRPSDRISLAQFRHQTSLRTNKAVIRAIRELEKHNLIKVTRAGTTTSTYEINLDELLLLKERYDSGRDNQ